MTFDFNELAKNVAKEVNGMKAGRCWLLHTWTRWTLDTNGRSQSRGCIKCGKIQISNLPAVPCHHEWSVVESGGISRGGDEIGTYFVRQCRLCKESDMSRHKV